MKSVSDIVDELGGVTDVARSFDPALPVTTVSAWRRRNHIPLTYWPHLVQISGGKLTETALLDIHLERPGPSE
jgi:hypothetical protein